MVDTTQNADQKYTPGTHPDLPPPPGTVGAVGWLRQNLFSSPLNVALTVFAILFLFVTIPPFVQFMVIDSTAQGSNAKYCELSRHLDFMGERAAGVDTQAVTIDASLLNPEIEAEALEIARYETAVSEIEGLQTQASGILGQLDLEASTYYTLPIPDFVVTRITEAGLPEAVTALGAAADAADPAAISQALVPFISLGEWAEPRTGACWTFVKVRWYQMAFGFYPGDQIWRVLIFIGLTIMCVGAALIDKFPMRKPILIFACIYPIIGAWLLVGGLGLESVATDKIGGMLLSIVLGLTGIVGALPLGIMLALGRRSKMPIIKIFCVCFIEFVRGVPLISFLFMGSTMIPLFVPEGVNFDKLVRALIAVTLFSAAYMAEVVRGGLQAIGRGQYEGAQALGLSYWKMMGFIVMPQALKIVIPGIVSNFIGLFKDTTLVGIIGLLDYLLVIKTAQTDPAWQGVEIEAYAFVALTYFCFCFSMARYSSHLENKLHTGHKR